MREGRKATKEGGRGGNRENRGTQALKLLVAFGIG